MSRAPDTAEKELRAFLRQRSLKLSGISLPEAWDAMAAFWRTAKFDGLVTPQGDGLAAYWDTTDHGRGMRLEFGVVRLLRLPPDSETALRGPALRLRLRLCYKWDMDIVRDVLPAGTWSHACWREEDFASFEQAVRDSVTWRTVAAKRVAEANVLLEPASWPRRDHTQPPGSRQMWWGIYDVR